MEQLKSESIFNNKKLKKKLIIIGGVISIVSLVISSLILNRHERRLTNTTHEIKELTEYIINCSEIASYAENNYNQHVLLSHFYNTSYLTEPSKYTDNLYFKTQLKLVDACFTILNAKDGTVMLSSSKKDTLYVFVDKQEKLLLKNKFLSINEAEKLYEVYNKAVCNYNQKKTERILKKRKLLKGLPILENEVSLIRICSLLFQFLGVIILIFSNLFET